MIKISALNEVSTGKDEEEDVTTITKEAQEQIALTEYNRALQLIQKEKKEDALIVFQDLLETELLDQVEKPENPDGRSRPMLSLKYACFKNIGSIQTEFQNYEDAIDNYWEAANLDDTDVTLWYRIGMLAMKILNLELACSAFKQGLKCNPNHWPCLDNIITVLFAVPDYMNCLLYISIALERDSTYIKGLAFRSKIFKQVPCLEECYKLYNSDWALDPPLDTEYDHIVGEKLLEEVKEISEKWAEICKPEFNIKPLPLLTFKKPLSQYSWFELGESLVDIHEYMFKNDISFASKVSIVIDKSEDTEKKEVVADNEQENVEENEEVMEIEDNFDVKPEEESEKCETLSKEDEEGKKEDKKEDDEPPVFDIEDDPPVSDTDIMEIDNDDDRKSSSSDIQVIELEDPLKLSESDIIPLDDYNGLKDLETDIEMEKLEDEKDSEKSKKLDDCSNEKSDKKENEKLEDTETLKQNDKSNDKSSDKSQSKVDEKLNDKSENKDESQKVKKRRRSSLCFLQQWAWSTNNTRRSARVRGGTNRKEAERDDVLLEETIRRIFPSSLLSENVKFSREEPSKSIDDSMDTMDLYQLFANKENTTEGIGSTESSKPTSPQDNIQQNYFGSESEKSDVEAFINEHSCKNNLMIIIAKYTEFLCTKWNHEWPIGLSEIYLQAYRFTREHIPHSPFGDESEDDILKLDAEMALLFGELYTDSWLDKKPEVVPSSNIHSFGTGMSSEELGFIIFASVRGDLFNEENILFLLRVLWLKANIFLCQGEMDIVIETLELLLNHMRQLNTEVPSAFLKLKNCKYHSHISIKSVEKLLLSIQRGQKLKEIKKLYEEKKYVQLAAILKETFQFAKQASKCGVNNDVIVDRVDQLNMLLDSLWRLEQYEECYVWSETCLNEAWKTYINSSDESVQKKWTGSILKILDKLDACTTEVSTFVVQYLDAENRSRLVQNLVHIVCHQLDVSDNVTEMPFKTVLPWILLHSILQYEEDKERAKSSLSEKNKSQSSQNLESDEEDEDKDIPASLMILFRAHEFLGRHRWCSMNQAKLLIFIMNLIIPKLRSPQYSSIRDKLTKYLEQIFYCLYGHPVRQNKARPKHLEDHEVTQIEITWQSAQLLLEFYRPDIPPEFDSPRALSISADTEILFKRISKLIPQESDPNQISEDMTAYITGEKDKMPSVSKPLTDQISSLYYLLADYYLKYQKWNHAAKYYLLHLCFQPMEVNSWVGLAMSTGTLIETWLNNCRPNIKEDKFLVKAKLAQCSYQRAIELCPANLVIWTEYGNFVYMIHSFCSRLLKAESESLNMERFRVLETRKEEMLEIAANCFSSANKIFLTCQGIDELQDERWLYQYMLAKIAEKQNEDPPIFLDHYSKASELLQQNSAQYPDRINHKTPQNLSVEALEVHYRIHASILKYLEQHEGKPLKKSIGKLFEEHLSKCAKGPFMKFPSKLNSNFEFNKVLIKPFHVPDTGKPSTVQNRTNSIEEIEIIDKSALNRVDSLKSESRKRSSDELISDNSKKIKLSGVSHLQLMQDVVALIDDLIDNVCEIAVKNKMNDDEITIISSDENDEIKPQNGSEPPIIDENGITENRENNSDSVMKESTEPQDKGQTSVIEDDSRKAEPRKEEVQEMEIKEKLVERKKILRKEGALVRRGSQESTTTQTSTTETNNSTSSSSDDSSSSEDSSDSDSSSDSESESAESEVEKKKKENGNTEEEECFNETETASLIAHCLAGLEQCILRFPEHYKSLYRMAHFFFYNKLSKSLTICRQLLLEIYHCQFYQSQTVQGLFTDRKSTNFFNGVWRIPSHEIDRPGSFASHMSRCVMLLMQVLKETGDSKMLMELYVQLQKVPESDKKYLRDSEREQLSRQAWTLCVQSLRSRIQSMGPPPFTDILQLPRADKRTQILLDVYQIHQQVAKKDSQWKESYIHTCRNLLVQSYKTYIGTKNVEGNVVEAALKYCQQANKIAATSISTVTTTITTSVTTSVTATTSNSTLTTTNVPHITQSRKPYKTSSSSATGRPRGRPPNVNKHLQGLQHDNMSNQFSSKGTYSNYLNNTGNRPLMNPYCLNPLFDPNMLAAMLTSGIGGSVMDPFSAMNYLNQMGSYQDILRQYQSNISSISNLATSLSNTSSNVTMSNALTMSTASSNINSNPNHSQFGNLNNLSNLTVKQMINLANNSTSTASRSSSLYQQSSTKTTTTTTTTVTTTTTTSTTIKERPDISITPVGSSLYKQKLPKLPSNPHIQTSNSNFPQTSKSTSQVSLLKTSTNQSKSMPPKPMSSSPKPIPAPTKPIPTVSKSIPAPTKPIPTASKPIPPPVSKSIPPPVSKPIPPPPASKPISTASKQVQPSQMRVPTSRNDPQPAHNSSLSYSALKGSVSSSHSGMMMKPAIPANIGRSGNTLQHKLQSKKQQPQHHSTSVINPMKKQKSMNLPPPLPNYHSLHSPFSGTSQHYLPSELSVSVGPVSKGQSSTKSPSFRKQKPLKPPELPSSLAHQAKVSESMSALSHLQQHSAIEIIPQQKSQNLDFTRNLPKSLSVLPQGMPESLKTSGDLSVFEIPRKTGNVTNNKRNEKPAAKDSVEIITLDD